MTRDERISRHKSFMGANWELIAAFSWEHYPSDGRGAVLVPEQDFVHQPTPVLKGLRFKYLPLGAHDKPPFADVFAEKELGWLVSYDPDARAVVCILREGGGVSSYLIGGRTRPSEAWARRETGRN